MDYDTLTIDLTAARTTPAELIVPYRRLVATYVPSPFTVRIGSPTAPPLVVRAPGVVCSCVGPIGRVYVTNDAGAGSAELFASDAITADFRDAGAGAARALAEPLYRAVLTAVGNSNLNPAIDITILGGSTGGPSWATGTSGASWRRGVVGAPIYGPCVYNEAAGHSGQWYLSAPLLVPVVALLHPSQSRRERFGRWAVEVSLCVQHSAGFGRYYFVLGTASGAFNGVGFASNDGGELHAVFRRDDADAYNVGLGVDLSVPRVLRLDLGSRAGAPLVRWIVDDVVRHESDQTFNLSDQFTAAPGGIVIGARAPANITGGIYTMIDRGLLVEHEPEG